MSEKLKAFQERSGAHLSSAGRLSHLGLDGSVPDHSTFSKKRKPRTHADRGAITTGADQS